MNIHLAKSADLASKEDLKEIFLNNKFDIVINLAAQAGSKVFT